MQIFRVIAGGNSSQSETAELPGVAGIPGKELVGKSERAITEAFTVLVQQPSKTTAIILGRCMSY